MTRLDISTCAALRAVLAGCSDATPLRVIVGSNIAASIDWGRDVDGVALVVRVDPMHEGPKFHEWMGPEAPATATTTGASDA